MAYYQLRRLLDFIIKVASARSILRDKFIIRVLLSFEAVGHRVSPEVVSPENNVFYIDHGDNSVKDTTMVNCRHMIAYDDDIFYNFIENVMIFSINVKTDPKAVAL